MRIPVTLTVSSGHKFACLSLKNVFCKYDGYPIQLQNGLSVHVKPKAGIDTSWLGMLDTIEGETLGTFNHDKLTNSNFLIVATDPSANPDHFNEENKRLICRSFQLFHAILMHKIPYLEGGIVISGTNSSGKLEPQSLQHMPTYHWFQENLPVDHPYDIDEGIIQSASAVAEGIYFVKSQGGSFNRLKRGIAAWVRAAKEQEYYNRLHEFVRAIEALIRPAKGKTEKQFVERCKTLAGGSSETIAKELFVLRSAVEHLNDAESELASISPSKRKKHVRQRARQAELLAGQSYIRLLSNRQLLERFCSDVSIDGFWNLPDNERQKLWGSPINISKLP
jgi:hypothetical protein